MATKVLKNLPLDVKLDVNVVGSYTKLNDEPIVYTLTSSAEGADPVVISPLAYGVGGNGPFVWFSFPANTLSVEGNYTLTVTYNSTQTETLTLCQVVNSGADTIYPSELGGHTCGQLNASVKIVSGGGSSITIDTTMPETPTDLTVPSTKLVKDYVDSIVGEIEDTLENL